MTRRGPEDRMPIGRVLVERRLVDARAVEDAALAAPASGSRLCSRLLVAGACDEGDLASALAERHGLPGVDLSRSVLDLAALALVPRPVAEADAILPLSTEGGRLHLAVASPDASDRIVAEVRFVTGREVSTYVAVLAALREAIDGAYGARDSGAALWRGEAAPLDARPGLALRDPPPPVGVAALRATAVLGASAALSTDEGVDLEILEGDEATGGEVLHAVAVRAGPPRVLVVDDEPAIALLAQRALQAKGYEVSVAANGVEALERARRELPDLVLLDAMLPGLHGFEVARRLRSDAATRAVAIVIMSAVYRGWRFASDARETYGAQDYLEKPFRVDELVRRVEAALSCTAPAAGHGAVPALERGRAEAAAGRLEAAEAALEGAVAADPFSAEAHCALGDVLRARGDAFRAMSALERAVDLRPGFLSALRSLADVYLEKGFRAKAAEALERAVLAAPEGPDREALRVGLLKLL
ncbi:MAG: response regulator [Anaeromyxobacteraceae bacterium]